MVSSKEYMQQLISELLEADSEICILCKRLNPQHSECTSCEDRERRLALIKEAKSAL